MDDFGTHCAIIPSTTTSFALTQGDVIPPGVLDTLGGIAEYAAGRMDEPHGAPSFSKILNERVTATMFTITRNHDLAIDLLGHRDPLKALMLAGTLFRRGGAGDLRHPVPGWRMSASELAATIVEALGRPAKVRSTTPWSPLHIPAGIRPEAISAWGMLAPPTVVLDLGYRGSRQVLKVGCRLHDVEAQDTRSMTVRMRHLSMLDAAFPLAEMMDQGHDPG